MTLKTPEPTRKVLSLMLPCCCKYWPITQLEMGDYFVFGVIFSPFNTRLKNIFDVEQK